MELTCALCNSVLTENNKTEEHIIPNAIGGRRTISNFICAPCNKSTGDDWDVELAKQLNPLSLFFGIKRDRKKAPSQIFETTGGDKVELHCDGTMNPSKPSYSVEDLGNGVHIKINARSMDELKTMIPKRKYPQIDIEEVMSNASEDSYYNSDSLHFNLKFGGHDAGRSIVKSVIALVVEEGVPYNKCDHAMKYLLGDDESVCFGYFFERDLVSARPDGTPLHFFAVQGDSNKQQILAYAELFGVYRIVMCLSSSYIGKDFSNHYAIDPMKGKAIEGLSVKMDFTADKIERIYNNECCSYEKVVKAFNSVLPIGLQRSHDNEVSRVLESSLEYAFANCGAEEGQELTDEQGSKIASLATEKMMPFFIQQIKNNRANN